MVVQPAAIFGNSFEQARNNSIHTTSSIDSDNHDPVDVDRQSWQYLIGVCLCVYTAGALSLTNIIQVPVTNGVDVDLNSNHLLLMTGTFRIKRNQFSLKNSRILWCSSINSNQCFHTKPFVIITQYSLIVFIGNVVGVGNNNIVGCMEQGPGSVTDPATNIGHHDEINGNMYQYGHRICLLGTSSQCFVLNWISIGRYDSKFLNLYSLYQLQVMLCICVMAGHDSIMRHFQNTKIGLKQTNIFK